MSEGLGDGGVAASVCASRGRVAFTLNAVEIGTMPPWTRINCMKYQRVDCQLLVLPDGRALALGGTTSHAGGAATAGPRNPEWIDLESAEPEWMELAAHNRVRGYHSSAVLLPDGRVFFAGGQAGDPPNVPGGTPDHTAKRFQPP